MPIAHPVWYQEGYWPLIGAALILLVPNAVALVGIFIQSTKHNRAQLVLTRIEGISEQLAEFYNPLYALIAINHDCFSKFGPSTFPTDLILRESAAGNWTMIRDRVVLPNNKEMAKLLRTKSHLIAGQDTIDSYLSLNSHINMYQIFVDSPTELYREYLFPQDIGNHIKAVRDRLMEELHSLRGERE